MVFEDLEDILKNKREVELSLDSFNNSKTYNSSQSLAKRLQNLLLMENGLPSIADCGVGIKTFIHEQADDATLYTLQEKIDKQVAKFLDTPLIQSVQAKYYSSPITNQKSIAIIARIADISDAAKLKEYLISFENTQVSSSTIVSKIYI